MTTKAGKRLVNGYIRGEMAFIAEPEDIAAIEAEAAAAKRVRIAENIEILRLIDPNEPDHPGPYYDGWHAALDAVLVIVETEP